MAKQARTTSKRTRSQAQRKQAATKRLRVAPSDKQMAAQREISRIESSVYHLPGETLLPLIRSAVGVNGGGSGHNNNSGFCQAHVCPVCESPQSLDDVYTGFSQSRFDYATTCSSCLCNYRAELHLLLPVAVEDETSDSTQVYDAIFSTDMLCPQQTLQAIKMLMLNISQCSTLTELCEKLDADHFLERHAHTNAVQNLLFHQARGKIQNFGKWYTEALACMLGALRGVLLKNKPQELQKLSPAYPDEFLDETDETVASLEEVARSNLQYCSHSRAASIAHSGDILNGRNDANLVVKQATTPTYGQGLFATREIQPGQILPYTCDKDRAIFLCPDCVEPYTDENIMLKDYCINLERDDNTATAQCAESAAATQLFGCIPGDGTIKCKHCKAECEVNQMFCVPDIAQCLASKVNDIHTPQLNEEQYLAADIHHTEMIRLEFPDKSWCPALKFVKAVASGEEILTKYGWEFWANSLQTSG